MPRSRSRRASSSEEPETPRPTRSSSGTPPSRRRSRRSKSTPTFCGRLCNDCLDLPWDKVVAGLITTLIIVIGATRVFTVGDRVADVRLVMEEFKAGIALDVHQLRTTVTTWESLVQQLLKKTEDRVMKQLQQELRERHDLDKRISMLEVKLGLLQQSSNNGDSPALPATEPLMEAVERATLSALLTTKDESNALFASVTAELELIRARVDALPAQQLYSAQPVEHDTTQDMASGPDTAMPEIAPPKPTPAPQLEEEIEVIVTDSSEELVLEATGHEDST